VFPRVYPPQLVYYQGRELFVDRAHNLLLDWSAIAGIPGLLAWSLVLVTFVIVAVRALRRPLSREKRALLAAVVCAVLGNVANNLVSFDVTSTATTTWLLMGLGVALAAPPAYDDVATQPRRRFYHWGLAALPLVGIGIAVWQMNARPLIADVAARSASRYAHQGAGANALAASGQAVAQWPVEPAHHLLLSGSYWNQAVADPASARNRMPQAEAALLAARRLRPGDPAVWLYTAQFYASVEQRFGGATRGLAEEAFGRALELAPNHATIHVAWGRFYLQGDNPQAAAPLLRQAVVLDGSNGAAYVYLGDAELALGRVQVALADYREAVRLLPASAQAYAGMAACYLRLDQPQQALTAAEEALRRDPHSGRALAVRQEIDRAP
jgi:tetratricopeptide (TPR) repeat protein